MAFAGNEAAGSADGGLLAAGGVKVGTVALASRCSALTIACSSGVKSCSALAEAGEGAATSPAGFGMPPTGMFALVAAAVVGAGAC